MNIFLIPIIFIVVVFVAYLVAGSCVRYRSGIRTCPEVLPNFIMWRRLYELGHRAVMCVVTCGRYRPQPERVVAVMPQMPSGQFRAGGIAGRDSQAFHQLPDVDDLDEDDFGPNEPSVTVQVRY